MADTFTSADLPAINAAITSGALSITSGSRTITYRSMSDLLRARDLILAESQTAAGTRRKNTFRMTQTGTGL